MLHSRNAHPWRLYLPEPRIHWRNLNASGKAVIIRTEIRLGGKKTALTHATASIALTKTGEQNCALRSPDFISRRNRSRSSQFENGWNQVNHSDTNRETISASWTTVVHGDAGKSNRGISTKLWGLKAFLASVEGESDGRGRWTLLRISENSGAFFFS